MAVRVPSQISNRGLIDDPILVGFVHFGRICYMLDVPPLLWFCTWLVVVLRVNELITKDLPQKF